MEPNLTSVVRDWHDFYGLVGTASATLVGLMFVTASVGASVFSASQQEPMKAYLTPTVVHFSSLLFICILILIPTQTWFSLSMALGGLGAAGVVYSIRQWIRVFWTLRSRIDLADRMFYVFIPSLGYLLVVVSAVALFEHWPLSAELIAAALIVLLLAGIRNAWDMTVWVVTRSQT
ncbi:MAG TPA: hypothetical protein VEK55_01550 [Xanthobacteraceae bacterium]|nr:hypothetical protein [Xanthobacteraceae bacterium]